MNKTIAVLTAVALLFVFSACGKKTEEKVDFSKEQVKIKNQNGEAVVSAMGNAQIPADFPKDIYVYPNTKILISQKAGKNFHLLLESEDAVETVINTYKQKMRGEGWKESNVISMGATGIFTYEKENRTAIVTISQSEKKKIGIQLQASMKK
jgi:hypothetical protein